MSNILQNVGEISRDFRQQKNNHKSFIVWFTGLSGSGKSTLAYSLEKKLYQSGCQVCVLDGDNVRLGLSSDLGFGKLDRRENMRRVGEVSKIMIDSGLIVLASFISPYRQDRLTVRKMFSKGDFLEVYCSASLSICEIRDAKGFYKRARSGEIKEYTGVDSSYEVPKNADLEIDTGKLNVDESLDLLVELLIQKNMISKNCANALLAR